MSKSIMSDTRELSSRQRFGFGVADFGFNLYYSGLNIFLLYYYTDVLGIRPSVAGLIFAVPLVWDAMTDPVMGVIASRTATRYGRYRPYLLFGAIPLGLSFVMMFAAPIAFPGMVVAATAIAHVAFRTCYTIVSIPFTAMSANITQSSGERSEIAGVRMFFAALGGLFTVFLTLPLAAQLGAGSLRIGFAWVSVLYALIATLVLFFTFSVTREKSGLERMRRLTFRETARFLTHNRALAILVPAIALGGIGNAIFGKALVYYVIYVANLNLDVTLALVVLTGALSLAVPFWMLAARRVSKRNVWLSGTTITASALLLLFLFPPGNVPAFLALIVLVGIGNGAFATMFWSMLPDTVEYGEFRSGVRDEGLVFGLNQFALKAASGLGIGFLGFMLDMIGYRASEIQTPETIQGLRWLAILVPFVCCILTGALVAFYPIDKVRHARLIRAIAWKRDRDTAKNSGPA